ncbi:MAG: hypothetical protein KC619_31810 [Myxococcales bacterium]|nr:hypothetical protein [Myxococcales bacterium]
MSHVLIACLGCARHVRASDPVCPFCGEALPASLRSQSPRLPTERLSRAATFVFGATLAASTAVGCGDGTGSDAGPSVDDAGYDAGNIAPPYGIPPDDAGPGDDAGTDAGHDAGNIAPPYGIPPDDAGPGDDAGTDADAGYDAGNIAPPYGIPPSDGGPAPAYGAPPP